MKTTKTALNPTLRRNIVKAINGTLSVSIVNYIKVDYKSLAHDETTFQGIIEAHIGYGKMFYDIVAQDNHVIHCHFAGRS